MHRIITYGILFMTLMLIQIFILDGINLGPYIYVMIYVGFILLLPMEAHPATVLMLGVLTGVAADIGMGTAGLNSIASITTAFIRPYLLALTVGRTDIRDGGVPSPQMIGSSRFLKYMGLAIFIHCLIYFSFEALSWQFYYLTLLKTVISAVISLVFIYIVALLFGGRG